MSKPREGSFRKRGKVWHVCTARRAPEGAEIIVQRKSDEINTVVVVGKGRKTAAGYLYLFADLGTLEAEAAKKQGGDAGLARVQPRRKKRAKPTPPADFRPTRPTGCVGGMTRERALVDARNRGPNWVPYPCEKCDQHHVEDMTP